MTPLLQRFPFASTRRVEATGYTGSSTTFIIFDTGCHKAIANPEPSVVK